MIKLKDILNEKSLASWSDDKKLLRWKVYIDGEKEPLILTGRSANEVKKFAHQMIKNNKVKIKKVVKEGKLTERNEEHFKKSVEMIYKDIDRLIKTFNTTDYKKNKNAKKFLHTAKQLKLKLHMALSGITHNVKEGKLTESWNTEKVSYSSKEAKNIMDASLKDYSKQLRKVQYNVIKDWMTKAKAGVLDYFDIHRGLTQGDARRAHPFETEFLNKVLTRDKIVDRFRKYFGGKKAMKNRTVKDK